jgi:membrane dipeptidase
LKRFQPLLLGLVCVAFSGCRTEHSDASLAETAAEIAQNHILVDSHIDVPYRLEEKWSDVTGRTEDGDFDYDRARRGGLDIAFMSIYTPAESEAEGTSFAIANRLIDRVEALAGRACGA